MESTSLFGERIAVHYEQWYATGKGAYFDEVEKQMLRRALSEVKNGSLLEVGCGTGHFTRFFAEIGFDAVGIDVSAPMLEKAKDFGASAVYIEADAHCLPFAAGRFDVVAFVTTVEFLAEPLKAIEEALRIASKQVIVGFLNRHSLTAIRRRVRGLFKKDLFSAAKFYSAGELTRLMKAAALNSGTRLELLKPQASWLNIGRLRLGAFAVASARLDDA